MRFRGIVLPAGLALAFVVASKDARADGRQTSDDLRIDVTENGQLNVEHRIGTRVGLGTFKSFDVIGVSKLATLEPVVSIRADDGKEFGAHATWHDAGVVRIAVDEPKGLRRGNYVLAFRYSLDGVAANMVAKDAAMWRVSFVAPVAKEGLDGARAVIRFVAAPTEPRAITIAETKGETAKVSDTVLASLRRSPSYDELELVRPHVARGEAPVWNVRVDPRALEAIAVPKGNVEVRSDVKPPPEPVKPPFAPRWTFAVGLAFGALVWIKSWLEGRRAAGVPSVIKPLLPLPRIMRALGAGGAAFGATLSFLHGRAFDASLFLVLTMVLATHRAVQAKAAARGPGSWLALRLDDAFRTDVRGADWMDGTTWRGSLAFVLLLAVTFGGALAAGLANVGFMVPMALFAMVLVVLFFTGTRRQGTFDLVGGGSAFLQRVLRQLGTDEEHRVRPWARIPTGQTEPDELRLAVFPKGAIGGVVAVEVGLALARTPKGAVLMPEVLVRVHEGSEGEQRLSALVPGARAVPGRKPTERVVRLVPRFPTVRSTVALVREVSQELKERRNTREGAFDGVERRIPQRPAALVPAARAS